MSGIKFNTKLHQDDTIVECKPKYDPDWEARSPNEDIGDIICSIPDGDVVEELDIRRGRILSQPGEDDIPAFQVGRLTFDPTAIRVLQIVKDSGRITQMTAFRTTGDYTNSLKTPAQSMAAFVQHGDKARKACTPDIVKNWEGLSDGQRAGVIRYPDQAGNEQELVVTKVVKTEDKQTIHLLKVGDLEFDPRQSAVILLRMREGQLVSTSPYESREAYLEAQKNLKGTPDTLPIVVARDDKVIGSATVELMPDWEAQKPDAEVGKVTYVYSDSDTEGDTKMGVLKIYRAEDDEVEIDGKEVKAPMLKIDGEVFDPKQTERIRINVAEDGDIDIETFKTSKDCANSFGGGETVDTKGRWTVNVEGGLETRTVGSQGKLLADLVGYAGLGVKFGLREIVGGKEPNDWIDDLHLKTEAAPMPLATMGTLEVANPIIPVEVVVQVRGGRRMFATNKHNLTRAGRELVKKIVLEGLKPINEQYEGAGYHPTDITIHLMFEGHTDERGGRRHNQRLSERRARSVAIEVKNIMLAESAGGRDPFSFFKSDDFSTAEIPSNFTAYGQGENNPYETYHPAEFAKLDAQKRTETGGRRGLRKREKYALDRRTEIFTADKPIEEPVVTADPGRYTTIVGSAEIEKSEEVAGAGSTTYLIELEIEDGMATPQTKALLRKLGGEQLKGGKILYSDIYLPAMSKQEAMKIGLGVHRATTQYADIANSKDFAHFVFDDSRAPYVAITVVGDPSRVSTTDELRKLRKLQKRLIPKASGAGRGADVDEVAPYEPPPPAAEIPGAPPDRGAIRRTPPAPRPGGRRQRF